MPRPLTRPPADGDRERRPLMVLSLDVKANKPPSTERGDVATSPARG
ncbi:MAG: hypothetical protein MZW92_42415 [Comamonadaceae bacterium]|nr:hypothetical protein [Comamonadaceae bacterium]